VPDRHGHLAVTGGLAVRDLDECLPDQRLEPAATGVQRHVEVLAVAGEVLGQLRADVVECVVVALPVVADLPWIRDIGRSRPVMPSSSRVTSMSPSGDWI